MAESQENSLENATGSKTLEINGETQMEKRIALITGITGQVKKNEKENLFPSIFLLQKTKTVSIRRCNNDS